MQLDPVDHKNLSLVFDYSKKAILKTMQQYPWWELVQDEVKESLDYILNNLSSIGISFRDSFITLFKYEHAIRLIDKQAVGVATPGILPGSKMSEEAYQSGIFPTKCLLKLDDWVQPNDADVHACMSLCHHIDMLESIGIFGIVGQEGSQTKVDKPLDPSLIKKLFSNPKK